MKKLKILVTEPNYIGDVLMTTPGLRYLKKSYPESEITVITTYEGKNILENNPNIDRILIRNKKLSLRERCDLIKTVRNIKPDMVFLFRTTFFYAVLSFLSRAKESYGILFFPACFFISKCIKPKKYTNYREQFITIVKTSLKHNSVKQDEDIEKLEIYTRENDKSFVNDFIKKNGLKNKEYILINPGTTRKSKLWSPQKYAELIKKLKEKKLPVIIGGTKNDIIIEEIKKILNEDIITVTEFKLSEYTELIRNAKITVSSDTGCFYISIAVMTKAVALFGSTIPDNYGPYNENIHKIIYKSLPCSPCDKNICPTSKNDISPCMDSINLEDVMEKIELLLRS